MRFELFTGPVIERGVYVIEYGDGEKTIGEYFGGSASDWSILGYGAGTRLEDIDGHVIGKITL